jgi:hypothetical protein
MINTKFPGAEYLSETKNSMEQEDSELKIEQMKLFGLPSPSEPESTENHDRNSFVMSPATETESQTGAVSIKLTE